jgi:hypothetical protein
MKVLMRRVHVSALGLLVFVVGCSKDPLGEPAGSVRLPVLLNLYPGTTKAGKGFNVQPDGQAALAVTCKDVSSGAAIVFASKQLPTAADVKDSCTLSAIIPKELYSAPGAYPVYIRDSRGESNHKNFIVK